MSVNHHPDDSTLLSYAAASLPASFATLVSCHLMHCEQCRSRIAAAEQIGTQLFAQQKTNQLSQTTKDSRERFLARLDADFATEDNTDDEVENDLTLSAANRSSYIPDEVHAVLLGNESDLEWKRLVPGIQQIKLESWDGGLRLLKIAPGISIPFHSHHGSELTLILQGSYSDELGRFKVGDIADLDPEIEHQPITDGSQDCICLIATDAPLQFKGIIPKLLQPFTGL